MKLDQQRIISMFAMLTDLPDTGLPRWSGLCGSAAFKIEERLRENVNICLNMERLCIAAAACAYFDYTMLTAKASSEEVRVGSISLKSAENTSDAASTRDYFLAGIADLLLPQPEFAFVAAGETL